MLRVWLRAAVKATVLLARYVYRGEDAMRSVLFSDKINVFGRREIVYEVETPASPRFS